MWGCGPEIPCKLDAKRDGSKSCQVPHAQWIMHRQFIGCRCLGEGCWEFLIMSRQFDDGFQVCFSLQLLLLDSVDGGPYGTGLLLISPVVGSSLITGCFESTLLGIPLGRRPRYGCSCYFNCDDSLLRLPPSTRLSLLLFPRQFQSPLRREASDFAMSFPHLRWRPPLPVFPQLDPLPPPSLPSLLPE